MATLKNDQKRGGARLWYEASAGEGRMRISSATSGSSSQPGVGTNETTAGAAAPVGIEAQVPQKCATLPPWRSDVPACR